MRVFLQNFLYLYFLIFSCFLQARAQCTSVTPASFATPALVCPAWPISFTNPDASSNVSYEWDFCGKDMTTTPEVTFVTTLFGANIPVHTKIVFDGNEYFLFVLSRNNSKLYRLDLGNSPENNPTTIQDLGIIPAGSYAESLSILKDRNTGIWYAFLCNILGNNNFYRGSFGASLKNPISYSFWGNISGVVPYTRAFEIIEDLGVYYFIATATTGQTAVISLGSSLLTPLSASNLLSTFTISGISTSLSLKAKKNCSVWSVIVASPDNKNYHLRYVAGLNNPPTSTVYTLPLAMSDTYASELVEEDGIFYAYNIDLAGKAHVSDYGNSLSNTPTGNFLGNISSNPSFREFYGASTIKYGSAFYFFGVNILTNQVFRTKFKRKCGANPETSNAASPSNIHYQAVGLHPALLRVRSNATGETTQVYTQDINVNATTTVADFVPSDGCLGSAVNFTNISVGSDSQVSSWFWNFGDGNTSTAKNPTHTYAAAGNYTVTLTANNLNGCNNSISKSIRISVGVTADFQQVATACLGQSISFNNLSSFTNVPFDNISGFYWNFGDNTYSPLQFPSKTYTQAGNYTITLTVRDEAGCQSVVAKSIQILSNPTVSFNFPQSICAGDAITFNAVASNATEYVWFFEGNGTSTNPNPSVVFAQAGFYDVTLQVKNANNCAATFTIENLQVLEAPKIIFNTQKINNKPLSVQFNNFTSGGITYLWNFGEGNSSTEFSPVHTYMQEGQYIVSLKAVGSTNCEKSIQQIVNVGVLDNNLAIVSATLQNGTISIELENKGNTLLNNLPIRITTAQDTLREVYTPTLGRGEKVNYTLQNTLSEEQIKNNPFFCVEVMPKSPLKDTDTSDNRACLTLRDRLTVFAAYPNPANEQIKLSFSAPNAEAIRIVFTDVLGKSISYQILASEGFNEHVFSLKTFAKGMYIVSYQFQSRVIKQKIVVL